VRPARRTLGFCVCPSRRLVYNATALAARDDAGLHDGVAGALPGSAAVCQEEAVSSQPSAFSGNTRLRDP